MSSDRLPLAEPAVMVVDGERQFQVPHRPPVDAIDSQEQWEHNGWMCVNVNLKDNPEIRRNADNSRMHEAIRKIDQQFPVKSLLLPEYDVDPYMAKELDALDRLAELQSERKMPKNKRPHEDVQPDQETDELEKQQQDARLRTEETPKDVAH